jgi:hypothetical protein
VCLHCRREARTASRTRRRRAALRTVLVAIVLGASLTGVAAVVMAFTGWQPPPLQELPGAALLAVRTATHSEPRVATPASPRPVAIVRVARVIASRALPVNPPIAAPPAPPIPLTPPLAPIVAEGRTRLRDSVVAIRRGDSVTVRFDTPHGRTRRPEKFEQIVRATLPAIYGPLVDSVLVRIPPGALVGPTGLLTDLPARGLRLSLGAGWALALWPATRPGQDGPLVVMYRALVERN